jgi:hypothetical protein
MATGKGKQKGGCIWAVGCEKKGVHSLLDLTAAFLWQIVKFRNENISMEVICESSYLHRASVVAKTLLFFQLMHTYKIIEMLEQSKNYNT